METTEGRGFAGGPPAKRAERWARAHLPARRAPATAGGGTDWEPDRRALADGGYLGEGRAWRQPSTTGD